MNEDKEINAFESYSAAKELEMIGYKDIKRKKFEYYVGKEKVFELIPQYKIKYSDEDWSSDFFNEERAAEVGKAEIMRRRNVNGA